MRTLELTPPKIAFVVATRAALGVGVGLLVSSKLSDSVRTKLGIGLAAVGALTTLPAIRMLVLSARG